MFRKVLSAMVILSFFGVATSNAFAQMGWSNGWTTTKPNKNYKREAPITDPIIVPKGEVDPLHGPGGASFIGILNPKDQNVSGKVVHSIVAGPFRERTVFETNIIANRGRLESAKSTLFESAASEVQVVFSGWIAGSYPIVNPNTDDWNRKPNVVIRKTFTSWEANGVWREELFKFILDRDLSYVCVSIAGINHKNASYVAFVAKINTREANDEGFPQNTPIDRAVSSTVVEPFSEEFDRDFDVNNWERLRDGLYLSDGAMVMRHGAFAVSQWMRVPDDVTIEIERDVLVEATIDHVKLSIGYTGVPPFGMIYGSGCATSFIDTIPHSNPCDSTAISFPNDVWIHERITYNPGTGIFVYYKDGVEMVRRSVGVPMDGEVSGTPTGTPRPSVSIFMHSGKPWHINNQLIGFLSTVTK